MYKKEKNSQIRDKSELKREIHKYLNKIKPKFNDEISKIDDILFMIDDYLDAFSNQNSHNWEVY